MNIRQNHLNSLPQNLNPVKLVESYLLKGGHPGLAEEFMKKISIIICLQTHDYKIQMATRCHDLLSNPHKISTEFNPLEQDRYLEIIAANPLLKSYSRVIFFIHVRMIMIQQMEELLETMAETIHEGNMHRISDLIERQQRSRDLFCRKFSTQLSQAFSSLGKIIDFLINTKP